ncbi:MAG: hypothetical protein AUH85_17460 [Chloroflexi bacterium 13_1_40CM_4_68_4]|nr:MAG: hypothetical protein AUH85_17460 [Chloroflexi bacterium 13_1_40CM_4_68_4]
MSALIEVVPIEAVDRRVLEAIAEAIPPRFRGRETLIAAEISLPRNAFDPRRGQYRAEAMLDELERVGGGVVTTAVAERHLGVIAADLFVPALNFVFGFARDGEDAVISLARLGEGDRLIERAVKAAVHELGHTYALRHCDDARCVMHFSNTLAEVDRTTADFCGDHRVELDDALALP